MADERAVAVDVRVGSMRDWARRAQAANERLLTAVEFEERARLIRERSQAEFEYTVLKYELGQGVGDALRQ